MKMPNVIRVYFVGILFCCTTAVWAEDYLKTEYACRKYTVRDGLPDMMINCLYQDGKGYLWMGLNNGLACYDGLKFRSVISDSEVAVYRITEAPDGKIRAFTHRAMYVVSLADDSVRKVTLTENMFLRSFISRNLPPGYAVYENNDETERAVYAVGDSGLTKVWTHDKLLLQDHLKMPFWDQKNQRFLVSADVMGIFDEDGVMLDSVATDVVISFVPHRDGMWVIGTNGLYDYRAGSLRRVCKHEFSRGSGVFGLINKTGQLIIKDSESIYRYDGGRLETVYDGLVNPTDMISDREGNLWVASYGGLYCFFGMHFKNYVVRDPDDLIRSVLVDRDNRLWAGTLNGRLIRITGEKQEEIHYPAHPHGNYFHPFPCIQGDMLVFKPSVLIAYRDQRFRYLNLPNDTYNYTAALPDGNLVAVSNRKLVVFQPDGAVVRTLTRQDLKQQPRQTVSDRRGRLWITGSEGITVVDDDDIRLMAGDSLKGSFLIVADQSGTIWFNAGNRLYACSSDHIRLVRTFPGTQIRGIHVTKSGTLIVATLEGIYLSAPAHPDMVFYNYNNGFTGNASFNSNMAEDDSGNVYVLTMEHMTMFRPSDLMHEQPAPLLYLKSMQRSDDNIRWTDVRNEFAELKYRDKNVKFNFIGICYSAAGNTRYRYRLVGFQDDWSQPQQAVEVVFNNLPPGRYEFQLKADSGVPGTETAVIGQSFVILPAFWQTWWFLAICIVVPLFFGGYMVYRYTSRKNIEKIKTLERQKQLNNLQIQSVRLRSIPHFNANVLAGIEYYIMNFSKEEANRYLAMYSSFTNLTLRDVDQPARTLAQEIRYAELYLGLEKMRYGEQFEFSITVASDVDKEILLPNMILHTHCENALKHGLRAKKDKGHIYITVDPLTADEVLVVIEDDGIGRVEAERLQTKGTGQGLGILSRQIDLYNQTNDVKITQRFIDLTDGQSRACGTRVEIEIPKGFRYN